jgi:hypothetical protein
VILIGQKTTEIAKTAIRSTVSIIALDKSSQPLGYGSGFIIDNETVVTNVHVVEGCNAAYVLLNGQEKKYTVSGYLAIDKGNDLIILKVPGLYEPKLTLSSESSPEIGVKVYAVGNPKGLNGTFSEGIVSGLRSIKNNQVLQITAPISPGSSGGPVLNSTGQVVGVAFASFTEGQNLNFAIPIKYLTALMSMITTTTPLSTLKLVSKMESTISVSPNIKEGIVIRNVEPCFSYYKIITTGLTCGTPIVNFSIKNNLAHPVKEITVLLLVYDKTGTVINYNEHTFFGLYSDEIIKPFLARSVEMKMGKDLGRLYAEDARIELRVLNFKIVEGE